MIGPFSLDAYLPAFPAMAAAFETPEARLQWTLAAYLYAFAVTTLLAGPWSDARGRREPLLIALSVYVAASAAIIVVPHFETVVFLRAVQGAAAAVGIVLGRAIVRDAFAPDQARRMYAQVMLWFSLGPAVAPVVGGILVVAFDWRAVFVALTLYGVAMIWALAVALPETLPVSGRLRAHPRDVVRRYVDIVSRPAFLAPVITFSALFAGLFVFISSSPALIFGPLNGAEGDFWWVFAPLVAGLVLGAIAADRFGGRLTLSTVITVGASLAGVALAAQATAIWLAPGVVVWFVLPLSGYSGALAWLVPAVTLAAMDTMPQARGSVSAAQSFVQLTSAAAVTTWVTPTLVAWVHFSPLGVTAVAATLWLVAAVSGYVWWRQARAVR